MFGSSNRSISLGKESTEFGNQQYNRDKNLRLENSKTIESVIILSLHITENLHTVA